MNAVEIEEAVSRLAEAPFDPAQFPYTFLDAFGNKEVTLKRLRAGDSNQSDLPGGVLQRNNIHLKVCADGEVSTTLTSLRQSPATARHKAKFILATDGTEFQAENLVDGSTVACDYPDFHNHFGFFLPLAGITTVQQISENAFDIKATGRLNRLYIELLKDNPEWGTEARREDLNHFFARLIFCFFAEDTGIFHGQRLFTATIEQMSARDSSDTHEVLSELFRAMDTPLAERATAKIKNWANAFPYVNGGLFSDRIDTPRFTKIARTYLINVGNLDWTKINPDIFGSMIQAVADDEERGALGMHYTSVPNILKVLNPLFLDPLREKLAEAADNPRKLLNLRQRIARIRVFDPACGSGNFLVIAYKELRAIEAEINQRRGEADRPTEITKENFRGIELRHFSCEIARLALIIAEYQCDVLYRGEPLALAEFLPLQKDNWIVCHNALRLDWLSVCPPTGKTVKLRADDLFETPLDQAEIEFKNEGGETYICGNPPYLGTRGQTAEQKNDLNEAIAHLCSQWRSLDYVAGWVIKAAVYSRHTGASMAFVTTNSICQGEQVPIIWPFVHSCGLRIIFAHTSFKWSNLAAYNAGVTVVIVGLGPSPNPVARLFSYEDTGTTSVRVVGEINAYLVPGENVYVESQKTPISNHAPLDRGSAPTDNGAYTISDAERLRLATESPACAKATLRAFGAAEFARGIVRWVLKPDLLSTAIWSQNYFISDRVAQVRASRALSPKAATRKAADTPERYTEDRFSLGTILFVPQLIAEGREYITCGVLPDRSLVLAPHFHASLGELFMFALIASRLHLVWIGTVCGKLKTDLRYSNTLGWNTFPVPPLTAQNKADLTRCAEDILLAREAHFPATIADLYDPESMPTDLRAAHERNDETLERIYIGRRFKNDTERLERLFALYTEMTASPSAAPAKKTSPRKSKTPAA